MRRIELDASGWTEPDDFYDALLPQLGAPNWYGRNLDALEDSIFGGDINAVQPPFHVSIVRTDELSPSMKDFLIRVNDVFADNQGASATISFSPPL
jgi:RNAse (barnase) inhibitor barstar